MKKKRKVLKYSSGNDSLIANRNLPEPNKCDLRNWQELRIINNKEGSYLPLAECGVEPLVAVFGGTPNLVLDGAVNVVLTEAFDDKELCILRFKIKCFRIVFIGATEVV